ncbi:hypothetical protein B1992_05145 [Pseudoxanthomonas broegbernensis]|uniref:Argininosuccinate lyase n=1 Tax=Pseudoxanthomonas broegbernensis TaxID=83619 RepID=A0A7V8GNV9_9GAMM|nr:hypothetical protein [Pseudoxanthomonas broegbernensis]KAF1687361.1 hypothetical protein B1992_05145 [Pseudoxanthomonas broegbernensis]MBB6065636.1 opacity protein-like surface antigen [Pseudoxanthomonas broegbernensis]
MKHLLVAAALAVAMPAVAQAEDLVFTLENGTGAVVVYFHASPADVDEWEEDVLGSDVLGPGESVSVTIADGRSQCSYDMRFEFDEDSGLEVLEDTQDLCELGRYKITD